MAALRQFFSLLGRCMSKEHIDLLWSRQDQAAPAAVANIFDLFSEVAASRFSQAQLEYLLSWQSLNCSAYRQALRQMRRNQADADASGGPRHSYSHHHHQQYCSHQAKKLKSSQAVSGQVCSSNTDENSPISKPSATSSRLTSSGCLVASMVLVNEPSNVRHSRARLLNLIRLIGVTTRATTSVDLCLRLLWQLAHDFLPSQFSRDSRPLITNVNTPTSVSGETKVPSVESRGLESSDATSGSANYIHPEPIEAALAQHLVVLKEFKCQGFDQRARATTWLTKAMEDIKLVGTMLHLGS
ncbi:unnamed protein product [Protopolystoma xenopodis]|uniref:Uncharacterized protein n=1 Tax=Protopolystoma xenopodis TaxID=117903 RepID=A0A448XDV7_9PLAT|nr:unnamed protein product [Protopolystoma xenopodis]